MITVAELIEHLKQFPQDARVLYREFSSPSELELTDVVLIKAEDKKIVVRNGSHIDYRPRWLTPEDEAAAEFVTAVHFPGN